MEILEVENLTKNFGQYKALDNVSFSITNGKVVGLLGPNGAGKTTTIHILLGITSANIGSIKYFGKDFYKNKQYCLQKINFASSFNTLQGRITVWENLLVFALLYGVKNPKGVITELLKTFEAEDLSNQKYWDLSSGQRTRINLVKSLLNDPQLILMDEPTASLDPDIADKTMTLIEKLKKEKGITMLYTSHNMNEITRICDEVIFLDKGSIVARDTPLGLTKKVSKAKLILTFDEENKKIEKYLKKQNYVFSFIRKNTVSIDTDEKDIPKLIFGVSEANIWIINIEIEKPKLEDVFLQIARSKK